MAKSIVLTTDGKVYTLDSEFVIENTKSKSKKATKSESDAKPEKRKRDSDAPKEPKKVKDGKKEKKTKSEADGTSTLKVEKTKPKKEKKVDPFKDIQGYITSMKAEKDTETKEKLQKALKRKYLACLRIVKAVEAMYSEDLEANKKDYERADERWTKAGSTIPRLYGLIQSKFPNMTHEEALSTLEKSSEALDKATLGLKNSIAADFAEGQRILSTLNSADKECFWKLQERNKGVTHWKDLKTIKK